MAEPRQLASKTITALCDGDRAIIWVDRRTRRTAPARSWATITTTPSGQLVLVWNT